MTAPLHPTQEDGNLLPRAPWAGPMLQGLRTSDVINKAFFQSEPGQSKAGSEHLICHLWGGEGPSLAPTGRVWSITVGYTESTRGYTFNQNRASC